jgi:SpoVK/Ycf46/Vps4 family AAA+-type ATPase
MVLLLAPSWNLPAELQHEIPVLQDPLPETGELETALDVIVEARKEAGKPVKLTTEQRKALLQSARGLTRNEAENAFALAAGNGLEPHAVETEKMRLVKSKCMSVEQPTDPESLGGMGELKRYVDQEVIPAKDDDQLRVRGILMVGIPGVGKSLACKAIAAKMGLPLVRLDISAAKGSLVGESEAALRHALATVDAVAPCVLWIDEIEKAVGGYSSSAQTDGGTTLGMVGALLTWLQEHTSPVVVVATCNDYQKLPPEMARAGRFDERFFLDLPVPSERVEIALIHLAKLGVEIDGLPKKVSAMTTDWTGAEIEQLVKSAARRTKRQVTEASLTEAAKDIIPISRSANIKDLREWANHYLRRANDSDGAAKTGRRIG